MRLVAAARQRGRFTDGGEYLPDAQAIRNGEDSRLGRYTHAAKEAGKDQLVPGPAKPFSLLAHVSAESLGQLQRQIA